MSVVPLILQTASPLELQVAALGICPKCHTKTLVERYRQVPLRWHQCSVCDVVYCTKIEPDPDMQRAG